MSGLSHSARAGVGFGGFLVQGTEGNVCAIMYVNEDG